MKKYIFTLPFLALCLLLAGCGGESGADIPTEEKEEVQKIETSVEELDEAAEEVVDKKKEAKASLDELMKEFNEN